MVLRQNHHVIPAQYIERLAQKAPAKEAEEAELMNSLPSRFPKQVRTH